MSHNFLTPRPNPKLLSIVMPFYNEEEIFPVLRPCLTEFLDHSPYPCEVIAVNDGSSDRTIDLLVDWCETDSRIKVLNLSRNFGHQYASTAGVDYASGDAVVLMDADLQDPLQVVHQMVEQYRNGYDVVCGQRVGRAGEGAFKKFTAWFFYRCMRIFFLKSLPPDVGDFRLMSRRCIDSLSAMRELHRFLRGMVAWVGFPQICVRYERQAARRRRNEISAAEDDPAGVDRGRLVLCAASENQLLRSWNHDAGGNRRSDSRSRSAFLG